MKTELQRFFFEQIQKNFDFLRSKFKGPFTEEGYCSLEVVFVGNNLAIEFVLDEREEDICCYIARVIDEKPPPHGFLDSQGKRVRGRLSSLLLAHGIRDKLFTPVSGLSLREQIPIIISDYVRALQKYGQRILDDDPGFLNTQNSK